ncbi:MAG: hypothetical protein AAGA37_16320 [Actinomycetota bacterium]
MTLSLPTGPARLAAIAIGLWVIQPFTSGVVIGEALDPTADPFRTTVSVAAWALWLLILLTMAVPRPVTLTLARLGATGGLTATVWAAIEAGDQASTATLAIGVLAAIAAFAAINLPGAGDRFVDGISYGDEARFLLRAPGPVLIALLPLSAAVIVVGATAGPLLLADERWLAGSIATGLGFAAAWFPLNAVHRLTNRFVVFVPNGLVVHDKTQIREPVLFVTREIAGLAPAPADTTAKDVTAAALGLALELRLASATELPFVTGPADTELESVRSILISPTRPAAVMEMALARGITIA